MSDHHSSASSDEHMHDDPDDAVLRLPAKENEVSNEPPVPVVKQPRRRQLSDYPIVDPIKHIKDICGRDYDFYKERPQGLHTPESRFRWTLWKNDWYFVNSLSGTGARLGVLVGRTVLYKIGIHDAELPDPSPEDWEETKGLPEVPMRREDVHFMEAHCSDNCFWPEMTEDPSFIPILDRPLEFPLDSLIVNDRYNATHLHLFNVPSTSDFTSDVVMDPTKDFLIKYNRIDPSMIGIPWVPLPPKDQMMVGHLLLPESKPVGQGNSAVAWKAELDLPYPLAHDIFARCYLKQPRTGSINRMFRYSDLEAHPHRGTRRDKIPLKFEVVAKIPGVTRAAHQFVNTEAKAYAKMPPCLSEHWTGYHLVPPVRLPQPASAVVPTTFGYFVPDVTYGKLSNGRRITLADSARLSPILLMENCGTQVEDLRELHLEYKDQLFSMVKRLHYEGFTQGSVSSRNWLVQPGPLRLAPALRSMDEPSFRLIDFGRSRNKKGSRDFEHWEILDLKCLENELGYRAWNYD